ncbi:hypothetical protein WN55_02008 [Dufourea novaeangliae]|uniref:Uncharacterized protein n=1 Tax=Dufourea novaeangliae TaxID=178035 RepID=A0A154PFF5_DUFNO|nr:hypothetical protein WN55_02008 [Dufourea novaeangliae]
MGKTPKKAAPGGDERNLYNRRRLKATTAASKTSETNLHERQRESESPNRSKLTDVQKSKSPGQRKNFKSKPGVSNSRRKFDSIRPMKRVGRPLGSTKKKLAAANKNTETKQRNMQPESEEAEVTLEETVQNKTVNENACQNTQDIAEKCIDHAPSGPAEISGEEEHPNKQLIVEEEQQSEKDEKINKSIETKESEEEYEENDLTLSLDNEYSPKRSQEGKSSHKDSKDKGIAESPSARVESESSSMNEKEDVQSESHTEMCSSSVNVQESVASELSEAEKETKKETDKEIENEKMEEKTEELTEDKDVSFVSYDPSIMLRDVQIKLNDCMKDNSKLSETCCMESETLLRPSHDGSFGKTLRNISGRRSLNRMRHVTLREHRYSPNNSMFVNTSSVSLLPSDETEDFKILRYSTGLSDTVSTSNGSPSDKKRKHETEEWNFSLKKQKTTESENSLLNTSISILKGLRRPIQVSTPVSELKFQSNKLDLTDDEINKSVNDAAGKKWCTIM